MTNVIVIPSTKASKFDNTTIPIKKRKVAAYARVSTNSDEQFTSFESQCQYYEKYIKSKPEWEFVSVYADEGISGTSTKNRAQFNKMIENALEGKIDLIITKSISRFARNTLDTIDFTRRLKNKGVEVYFEKENLRTFDDKAEFLLAIMSSIAQEESRSISQNITMGRRWKMKEGQVSFAYSNFLGYRKEKGAIVIDEKEAPIVRLIYHDFLVKGKSSSKIAKHLNEMGILTPMKKSKWTRNTIYSILRNEKYKGDALLQKTYVKNFLDHRTVKNNGELPKYLVENSHPAIIDRDMWEMVQYEIKRREEIGSHYSSNSVFSSKIVCGDCGGFYGRKIWHSNQKYRKIMYQCNARFAKGKEKCKTPPLSEENIKSKFIEAYNRLMADKEQVIEDAKEVMRLLSDSSAIDVKITEYENEMAVISKLVKNTIQKNTTQAQSQEESFQRYNELEARYQKAKERYSKLCEDKILQSRKAITLKSYLGKLEGSEKKIEEWHDDIWTTMLEKAVVNRDKSITFQFIIGKEITLKI